MDLNQLNEAQREAVTTTSGSLLILAGPGTGKTRVIIQKISYLLEKGIPPHQILAMTFSRKATEEMEERLLDLHPEAVDQIEIQTLHSFCTDFVKSQGFRLGFSKTPRMMEPLQAKLLIRQIADRLPLQFFIKSSNYNPLLDSLFDFMQASKDQGLWPEDVLRYALDLPEATEEEAAIKAEWTALGEVYAAFQDYCFQEGYFDFGDAILSASRLLADFPLVKEQIQNRYQVILIDEFQDTNWSQVQLLRHLCKESTHIAVVGDDDQSIYKFRGASFDTFRFFEEAFPGTKEVELSETYRLPPAVVEVANTLIRSNTKRFREDKRLVSRSSEAAPVSVYQFASFEDEAFQTAKEIQEKIESGVEPREIGVLVRAHGHAELFAKEAKRRGIPLESTNPETLFDQPIVKDIVAFLKLLLDPKDAVSFARLFDSIFIGLKGEEILALSRWQDVSVASLDELDESPLAKETREKLQHFYEVYLFLVGPSQRKPTSELLFDLYSKTQIFERLLEEDEVALRAICAFHQHLFDWETAQPNKELPALFPLLLSLFEEGIGFEDEPDRDSQNVVRVLTTHASKGLEFEHVYILSLVGRRFPGNFRTSTWPVPEALSKDPPLDKPAHLEEERRLFYVGMTRTKKKLTLSTISKKGTKPSVFLTKDIFSLGFEGALQLTEFAPLNAEDLFRKIQEEPLSRIEALPSADQKESSSDGLKLSFTQLDKYEICPLQYRFAYNLRIPTASSPALLTGSAVHEALEKFYKDILNENEVSKEKLIEYFDQAYDRDAKEHGNFRESDKRLATEHLERYYDLHDGNFQKPAAIEEPFQIKVDEHLIRGKIDRADHLDGGYRIIDYKTGKAKSNDSRSDQKFAQDSLQFSIYALAAEDYLGWNVKELVFYYLYENQELSTTRSKEDLEQTKERVRSLAQKIQQRQFEPTPGFHCQWCEYRRICPAAV